MGGLLWIGSWKSLTNWMGFIQKFLTWGIYGLGIDLDFGKGIRFFFKLVLDFWG